MRAAAVLVKFVPVPLLLVYTAILDAYAAKIALAWELPKGTLGAMVVGYLFVGAATLLLGYPSRETGGALVRLFWRYWVWLAALPVALLFVAVSRRVADYGLTEQRYLMVLIGIWALILAAFRLAQGARFDLRLLPGVLALLLLAASFGPGGAIGLSVLSQKAELASILSGKGMLVDGKIVPRGEGAAENPLGEAAARARAVEWYLNTHHSLGLLAPWFWAIPTIPSRPASLRRRPRASCLSRSGSAPISATLRAWFISRIIPTSLPCSFRARAHMSLARSCSKADQRPRPFRPRASRSKGLAR
jgi:hypothetical protein